MGVTTMDSPVWMPMGSMFSMLQMVLQVLFESLITSYSSSIQPPTLSSRRTWLIRDLFREIVAGPCGLRDLLFNPAEQARLRAATTEYCPWRARWIRGEVHDENSWSCAPIEAWIDEMDAELQPLRAFILPGGSRAAALAHVVRTVCRRAERRVNLLQADRGGLPTGLLTYLNRLSEAFFVLARFLNLRDGLAETEWRPRSGASSSKAVG